MRFLHWLWISSGIRSKDLIGSYRSRSIFFFLRKKEMVTSVNFVEALALDLAIFQFHSESTLRYLCGTRCLASFIGFDLSANRLGNRNHAQPSVPTTVPPISMQIRGPSITSLVSTGRWCKARARNTRAMHNAREGWGGVTLTRYSWICTAVFAVRMRTRAKKRMHVLKPVRARVFSLPIFRHDFVFVCNLKAIFRNRRWKCEVLSRPVKIRKLISWTPSHSTILIFYLLTVYFIKFRYINILLSWVQI